MRGRRSAFSLAELMIALAILGMGLLVIGAALPAGAQYTRRSVDLATGAAAAQYGLDMLEQSLCIYDQVIGTVDGGTTQMLIRTPGLFTPRLTGTETDYDGVPLPGQFDKRYEPLVKVRPLPLANIIATKGSSCGQPELWGSGPCPGEWCISQWLEHNSYDSDNTREVDASDVNLTGIPGPWLRSPVSPLALVYPPIAYDTPLLPADFFSGPYTRQPLPDTPATSLEAQKALDRQVAWTGFYRRVSYAPDSDPCLYELIVVAARRVSENSTFARQDDVYATGVITPTFASSSGTTDLYSDRAYVAPTPFLVTFKGWTPNLILNTDYTIDSTDPNNPTRALMSGYKPPGKITFYVSDEIGKLCPPGSALIPALNDRNPNAAGGQMAGFVPSCPDALPIYEVAERTFNANAQGYCALVVKDNGFYPWMNPNPPAPYLEGYWCAWVVPPSASSVVSTSAIFDDRSSSLAVARRYVRLREVK